MRRAHRAAARVLAWHGHKYIPLAAAYQGDAQQGQACIGATR
eukprot:CAMPEP_0168454488 /NCGR_PEP_ID=MMETSP0228-20121227/50245_1 /TAXON_ID=133427 /ORGANISM="Protoceratium reticulatum, Strain CCCM 535 (=CCMP 1889)" /LENGTH=41 /DNA_ID= /DNA_START= /DNA_END= /DNA_ORIENTATION=